MVRAVFAKNLARPPTVKIEPFIPRSDSPWIFAIAMASYIWISEDLVKTILAFFNIILPPTELSKWSGPLFYRSIRGLLISPVFETCILIGAIELLRRLKLSGWLQILISAAILSGAHAVGWAPHALIVMPSFTIQGASYLWWRPKSLKKAFAVVVCTHSLVNLIPVIFDIASATG